MTDEELIGRLRDKNCCESPSCNCDAAADRIEALMKREAKLSVLLDAAGSVADIQKHRAERLEAALKVYACDCADGFCHMSGNECGMDANAALKGADHDL